MEVLEECFFYFLGDTMDKEEIQSLAIKEGIFFPADFKKLKKSSIIFIKEGRLMWLGK